MSWVDFFSEFNKSPGPSIRNSRARATLTFENLVQEICIQYILAMNDPLIVYMECPP